MAAGPPNYAQKGAKSMARASEQQGKVVENLQKRAKNVEGLVKEIDRERERAEKEGLSFTAPTAEQLEKKLSEPRSPMIVFQGWGSSAPGGTISYSVGINNPDPNQWIWLFVHVFVGAGNIPADPGTAVLAVDPRFPRLTLPRFAGLTLAPGTTQSLNFSITVPTVERTNYLGNAVLFQSTWHDPARYLDRALFVFEVT